MVHAQKKGKRGEDLFCKWLFENFEINIRRNHWQADGHSADIIIDDFIFEIKNRETHNFDDYWHQIIVAKKSHINPDLIPVVAYKSNNKKWRFLIPATLITGIPRGYVDTNETVFIHFMKYVLEK